MKKSTLGTLRLIVLGVDGLGVALGYPELARCEALGEGLGVELQQVGLPGLVDELLGGLDFLGLHRIDRLALESEGVAEDLAHVVEHRHLLVQVGAGEDRPAVVVARHLGLVHGDAGGSHVVGDRELVVRIVVLRAGEDVGIEVLEIGDLGFVDRASIPSLTMIET